MRRLKSSEKKKAVGYQLSAVSQSEKEFDP
jgi:hypothetical protein